MRSQRAVIITTLAMPTIPCSDHIASSSTIDHDLYGIITIDGKCVTTSSLDS